MADDPLKDSAPDQTESPPQAPPRRSLSREALLSRGAENAARRARLIPDERSAEDRRDRLKAAEIMKPIIDMTRHHADMLASLTPRLPEFPKFDIARDPVSPLAFEVQVSPEVLQREAEFEEARIAKKIDPLILKFYSERRRRKSPFDAYSVVEAKTADVKQSTYAVICRAVTAKYLTFDLPNSTDPDINSLEQADRDSNSLVFRVRKECVVHFTAMGLAHAKALYRKAKYGWMTPYVRPLLLLKTIVVYVLAAIGLVATVGKNIHEIKQWLPDWHWNTATPASKPVKVPSSLP